MAIPLFVPNIAQLMPRQMFERVTNAVGTRLTWQRSHTCPCIYAGAGANGRLPLPGTADPGCLKCRGVGVYWDASTDPFVAAVSFMHMSPSPDEPGVAQSTDWGPFIGQEPSVTIPYADASGVAIPAWSMLSVDDALCAIDHHQRFTAVLQVGGITALPYQNNILVAATGAVTTYDPVAFTVSSVSGYVVSGTSVLVSGYATGTNYMVEFTASPMYVAFRKAGALPHERMFGAGAMNLPARWRVQTLDYWTRARLGGAVPNVYPANPKA